MGAILKKELNYKSYNKQNVKELTELFTYIYVNNDECFIRVLNKGKGITKAYPISALKDPIKVNAIFNSLGKEDIFVSLNPFRTMRSGTRNNLFCINAIAVDVDYKNKKVFKDLDPKQIINLLELDIFDQAIPMPNLIEYGNQIRLIYTVEPCYIPKYRDNVVVLAQRISEVFADELKDYGAERQNLESYYRVPQSTNSKNGAEVNFLAYDNTIRYTLRELQELWLDELPKWYKRRKGRTKDKKKVVKLHNVYTLNCNRLRDLEKIQAHLNSINESNLRARLCFLYRNFYLIKEKYQKGALTKEDFKNAEKEMLRFNNNFKEPYRNHVIEVSTRSVNHTQYLYKSETLVNFLELTWELCEEIGLEGIYKPKSKEQIDKDYYKRNSKTKIEKAKSKYKEKLKTNGKLSKKEEVSQRRAKIKDLLAEGLTQKDICLQMNISKITYIRDRKALKEQGLI
ncbi:helix-turn-helix domain-containing protein (plasmid) [Clostridium perfringens]|uniref:helix-turn-helix domain-containing protein n=1 Tax=Clostridium perfringens TaxID=1502 RepID=UPI0029409745|nr:helix-turn-helix domain-containing protein [Clostridium perfringens]MDV5113555.1 helix-turn-helix domain-containing protein [Clostridium perfringens]